MLFRHSGAGQSRARLDEMHLLSTHGHSVVVVVVGGEGDKDKIRFNIEQLPMMVHGYNLPCKDVYTL